MRCSTFECDEHVEAPVRLEHHRQLALGDPRMADDFRLCSTDCAIQLQPEGHSHGIDVIQLWRWFHFDAKAGIPKIHDPLDWIEREMMTKGVGKRPESGTDRRSAAQLGSPCHLLRQEAIRLDEKGEAFVPGQVTREGALSRSPAKRGCHRRQAS
jgi:hypothetical protein